MQRAAPGRLVVGTPRGLAVDGDDLGGDDLGAGTVLRGVGAQAGHSLGEAGGVEGVEGVEDVVERVVARAPPGMRQDAAQKAQVQPRPAAGQLVEGRLDQASRALGLRVGVGPCERARKGRVRG